MHVIWEEKGQLKRACTYKSIDTSTHYKAMHQDLGFLTRIYACAAALENRVLSNYNKEHLTMDVNGYHYSITLPPSVRKFWDWSTEYTNAKLLVKEYETKVATGQIPRNDEISAERYGVNAAQEVIKSSDLRLSRTKQEIREEFHNTYIPSHRHLHLKDLDVILHEMGHASSLDLYSEIEKKAKELAALTNNWMTSYATIEQQGQLFIAVSGVWK